MADKKRLTIGVINLKGGTGKTTTSVFLAHAFHELGYGVLLVDGDPQGSVVNWNNDAPQPFPFPVVPLPTADLDRKLPDYLGSGVDVVIIDTLPLDQKSGVVTSTVRVADIVVVPIAPSPMEYRRLQPVVDFVNDAADFRSDRKAQPIAVMLTRTVPNATSTMVWRQQIESDGLWCLQGDVRRLERFSQAYGDNVTNALGTVFAPMAQELIAHSALSNENNGGH